MCRRVILPVFVAILVVALAWPCLKTACLTTLVLLDVSKPGADGPLSRLRPAPVLEQIELGTAGGNIPADLYLPPGPGPHPGIVIVHGMHPEGRRESRLANFADAMARASFAALVPEFRSLAEFRVSPGDVDVIVEAFEALEARPDVADDRVGIFGLSYSGGLSVLAASDGRIADRVRFVFALGGHYDLRNVVVFMATGGFRDADGPWVFIEPQNYGRWAFLLNGSHLADDESDARLLAAIAGKKLADRDADISREEAGLGEQGKAVLDLMTGEDPDDVLARASDMSGTIAQYFELLSPRGRVGRLRARLIAGHGMDDRMIPYTESVRLAEEVSKSGEVHLELLESLHHMDIEVEAPSYDEGLASSAREFARTARELSRLFSITYDLLSQGGR